ncbi:STM4011 family radical SAM protein [Dyella silvatica]|uniref:STM4011 family radical SAM protein n=1 Tax=Dyella silvatica TaxID=2992128 RepID=UPI0022555183|nr:STM4011 family radical SAM protein [Dyella silvatica]
MSLVAHLSLLYRGRLSSCNYDCSYCPFAKTRDSRESLRHDANELSRFVAWVEQQTMALSILFTPWGEGLVRRHYREAMVRLSHMPQLRRVAIQTNLCIGMRWLDHANLDTLALWCTYHPSQVSREAFLGRCRELSHRGVRYSVGMVAMHEHLDEIDALRHALPPDVPLWLNAYDERPPGYYSAEQVARLQRVDAHFLYNMNPLPSLGAPCLTGEEVLSVDGAGNVQRCHFVTEPLGNLYDGSFVAHLRPRVCPNRRCECYIGYAHRRDLPFQVDYVGGVLERVPAP